MDGRHEVTMSDDALDRELRAALNVEPSPEFLARVRGRVADESPVVARPLALRWLTMSAGATVAAIAVAVFLWSPLRSGGGAVSLDPGATPAPGG